MIKANYSRIPKKRGIMLVFAIMIIALLIILLTASMVQLQNSIFLTNRVESESRAYWASFAGMEYAESRVENDILFASSGAKKSPLMSSMIGDYYITETSSSGGILIHGYSEKVNSDFYVAFNTSGSIGDSIVPPSLFSDSKKVYQTYSCNGIIPNVDIKNTKNNIADKELKVSSAHKIKIPKSGGVYISCEGVNRNQKTCLERLYQARAGAGDYFAALFTGGKFNASMYGTFSVSDVGGRSPNIVTLGGMNINSSGSQSSGDTSGANPSATPDRYGNGPLVLQEGTVFTNLNNVTVNGTPIATGDYANMQKYGIRVESADAVTLPKVVIPSDNVSSSKRVPGGNYVFVEKPAFLPNIMQDLLGRFPGLDKISYSPKPTNVSKAGNKSYELFYFPPDYNPTDFTIAKYQKSHVLLICRGIIKKLENLPLILEYLAKALISPIYLYMDNLKKELNGDVEELKDSTFFAFKPKESKLSVDYSKIRQAPFSVRNDLLTLTVTDDISIEKYPFVFQTIEANPSNFASYWSADYARSALTLTNSNPSKQVRFYSYEPVVIKGFMAGKGEMICDGNGSPAPTGNYADDSYLKGKMNYGDISIEAGGKLDAEGENEIAIFAGNNLNITYVSAIYARYKAPQEVHNAIADLKLEFPAEDYSKLPEIDSRKFKRYAKALLDTKTSSGKTLRDILKTYGMSSDLGYNAPENYIYDLMCREPQYLDPSYSDFDKMEGYRPFVPTSNVRGILYSKGNMRITPQKGDVALEGIVICEKDFEVSGATNLAIRYDPTLASISVVLGVESYTLSQIFYNRF